MKEEAFRQQVRKIARMYGWTLMYHTHSSVRSDPGFPDEVLLNKTQKRVLFIEFKSEKGRVRPAQKEWIEALQLCGQEAAIWRPSDMEQIVKVLGPSHLCLYTGAPFAFTAHPGTETTSEGWVFGSEEQEVGTPG